MPITAKYLYIVSMDVEPDKEALFNEVYDSEHVPNILKVPGVISATRTVLQPADPAVAGAHRTLNPAGEARYSVVYEIESPDIMFGEAWKAEAEKGRWPTDVRPHTKNRSHVIRKVLHSRAE